MRYANIDNLIADYIPEAKSQKEKDAIGRILDSVSEWVDVHCKRTAGYFASILVPGETEESEPVLPAPTVKRVRGEGQNFLRLPVHVFGSIEEVKTSYGSIIPEEHITNPRKTAGSMAKTIRTIRFTRRHRLICARRRFGLTVRRSRSRRVGAISQRLCQSSKPSGSSPLASGQPNAEQSVRRRRKDSSRSD